ncbi:MAG: hypothetical protein KA445_06095, partial [Sediminibacterium sp.]|nr:hypothetical protein [Sediminibacterium sp.]
IVIFIFQMMKMKSVKNTLLLALMSLVFVACSKGGDSPAPPTPNPPVVTEPSLTASNAVIVDIDPGTSNIYAVLGTTQKMEVRLTAIPASGVTIDTKMIKVADNTTAFSNSISSTSLINPVNVTGLVPGVLYNLSVVVTSKTTASNTKTIEFKMAAK